MENDHKIGKLYVVATPIGNSSDMSPRGCEILKNADIIACEDTRRSMVLLNILNIRGKLVSNHKFNEHGKANYFIREMLDGKSVAVISDAGTPCISDPGNELIKAAIREGIEVMGVPGCCAFVTALSVSGFDLTRFEFYGFFPRENADRKKMLSAIRNHPEVRTYAFYESPKRIMNAVEFFAEQNVGCEMCLCNDLTKLHEMCFRGRPDEVIEKLLKKGNYDKGEFVMAVMFDEDYMIKEKQHVNSAEALITEKMSCGAASVREAIEELLNDENNTYSKNELKKAGIRLKEMFAD